MLVDIIMPKMGESITEGTIIEWRKKIGDNVEKDEIFLEIGTDKSTPKSQHRCPVFWLKYWRNQTMWLMWVM